MRHRDIKKGGITLSVDPPLQNVIESLADAAKLNEQDARTIVYWRLGSRYAPELSFYPNLALVGPAGSGKTTIMESMGMMPGEASGLHACTTLTVATARDLLASWRDKVFFADEFDSAKPDVAALFMARTTRSMAEITYKEAVTANKFKQTSVNIFGPSVLHLRNSLDDPAQSSRAIQIFTRHEDGPYPDFECDREYLDALTFDMSQVKTKGGRIVTTWAPVIEVARQVGDEPYLKVIQHEIEMEKTSLREKAEFDNASLVLAKVIEYLYERPEANRWDRIDVEAYIGRPLRFDYPYLAPLTIATTLRGLGFFTVRAGGRRWLFPDPQSLAAAKARRNFDDEKFADLFEGSAWGGPKR